MTQVCRTSVPSDSSQRDFLTKFLLLPAVILSGLSIVGCQQKPSQNANQTVNSSSGQTASFTAHNPSSAAMPIKLPDAKTVSPVEAAPATIATPLTDEVIAKYNIETPMVKIKGGTYRPLYLSKDSPLVKVSDFTMDTLPVTNAQFYHFVKTNPKWQKQNIAKLFTEEDYLRHWQKNTQNTYQPIPADLRKPVVYVSWYAANAYCKEQGKRLPSVAQWEYVAQASETNKNGSKEKGYNQKILDWYGDSAKKPLTDIAQDKANFWGVHNMHGLIWEWTDDFNSNLVTGESRSDGSLNQGLFCGSGAAGAVDPSDYAAFMRYGFRSSLASKFALSSLGFRCAKAED